MIDPVDLVSSLASHGIAVAGRHGPIETVDSPHAEEMAAVAAAVPRRRDEHLTGRALARRALHDLGVDAGPIGRRDDRSPDWPRGVGGSITHTEGLCAVVVARLPTGWSLGIDAEVDAPLDDAVLERVLSSLEVDRLGGRVERDGVIVYSAKESVFKAVNPMTGRWLEPHDIEVTLRVDDQPVEGAGESGVFDVDWCGRGRRALAGWLPVGRWVRCDPWVATGCVLRPS